MNKLFFVGTLLTFFMLASGCGDRSSTETNNAEGSTQQDTLKPLKLETIYSYENLDEVAEEEMERVIGTVKSVGETGRGPEIMVTLETKDGETFEFNVLGMTEMDFPTGSERLIRYRIKKDSLIVGISFPGEDIETATAHLPTEYSYQETARKNMKNAKFTVEGTYLSGEQGDMGKYVFIKQGDKELDYSAGFDSDVDNVERYQGKKVVLYGAIDENIDLLEVFAVE